MRTPRKIKRVEPIIKMKNYFSHDYNARDDIKLQKLQMVMKHEGKGIYWDLVEMLYEQGGKLELSQCDGIAFALHTDSDKIKQVIELVFEQDDTHFWSNSVFQRAPRGGDETMSGVSRDPQQHSR